MSRCTDVDLGQVWYVRSLGSDPARNEVSEAEVVFTYDDGTTETVTVQAPR